MIKLIIFRADNKYYVVIPDPSHTEESWEETKRDIQQKLQYARNQETEYRTDGSTIRDTCLGLKLLDEHAHTWQCSVREAEQNSFWELAQLD